MIHEYTMGFLIGYFIFLYPIMFAVNGTIEYGFLMGIVGLLFAFFMNSMEKESIL